MKELKNLDVIFELLDDFTLGGKLYYDDENDSIWMINPETKQWIFKFQKSGTLWYYYPVFADIFKWISMEYPDFVPYITKWVERILQNEVKNTSDWRLPNIKEVERILQNEVKNTAFWYAMASSSVERILQNEVKNTWKEKGKPIVDVERILQSGTNLNPEENINESINEDDRLDVIFELLDDFTSGGKLYYDENDSIWMINPETKQWIFEFEKSGDLWYSYQVFTDIFNWLSMEYPDFVPYITKWVERILQKEVKNTWKQTFRAPFSVERILQSGNELNPDNNLQESIRRILRDEIIKCYGKF